MSKMNKDECLKDLKANYLNPSSAISYSGLNSIYRHYKGVLSYDDIREFLGSVESYTLHREYKNLKRNPNFSHFRRFQFQTDLIDIRKLSEWNNGINYILSVIDTFSRKAWIEPVKSKTSQEVLNAFQNVLSRAVDLPLTLVADKGSELRNKFFINFCKQKKINFFHNNTSVHCSFIERFNRTIQNKLYKYMSEHETRRYIDKLDDFERSYNSSFHRAIGMPPEEADKAQNQEKVSIELSRYYSRVTKEKPRYEVNQLVRLALQKTAFHRGYKEQSNYEVFNIYKINTKMPKPLYHLETYDKKEKLEGGFYAHEITPVNSDIFRVEKVIKTRRRGRRVEHLVRWKGYSSEHDSWVKDSDIAHRFNN